MSFQFPLPTTSPVSFSNSFISSSAPSLPFTITTHRSVLRDNLKRHKRLPPSDQQTAIPNLLNNANEYLPYLHTLDAYLTSQDVTQTSDFETEWRATLSKRTTPAGDAPRVKRKGLEYEVLFATMTLAYIHTLRARLFLSAALQGPNAASSDTSSSSATSSSTNLINQSSNHLLLAASIFTYLQNRSTMTRLNPQFHNTSPYPQSQQQAQSQPSPTDTSTSTFTSLTDLCMSSATLLAVLKEDPYPSQISTQHDKSSKEWMYKAPTVPTGVKALLMARFCMEASDLAGKAAAGLNSSLSSTTGVNPELKQYCEDLSKTAKAKACRFLGVDAEAAGRTGEAIGWIQAGREILGIAYTDTDEKPNAIAKGLEKLKRSREERRYEKAGGKSLGLLDADAGRTEEGMVLSALEKKWIKINDSVTFQPVKATAGLLSLLPSGRGIHPTPKAWVPPKLTSRQLLQLQNQAPDEETDWLRGDDSDDDGVVGTSAGDGMPGGFPGRSGSTVYC